MFNLLSAGMGNPAAVANPASGLLSGLRGLGGATQQAGGDSAPGGLLGGLRRIFDPQPVPGMSAEDAQRQDMMRKMMFAQLGAGIAGGQPALGLGSMLPYMMMRQ